jgi:hypothetical protein
VDLEQECVIRLTTLSVCRCAFVCGLAIWKPLCSFSSSPNIAAVGFGRGMVPRVLYKVCIFLWMTGTRGFVLAERMYCCSFNFFNLVNLDLY